jgi:hypothetical protein
LSSEMKNTFQYSIFQSLTPSLLLSKILVSNQRNPPRMASCAVSKMVPCTLRIASSRNVVKYVLHSTGT